MQEIFLFIDSQEDDNRHIKFTEIGNLFINRFAIEEDARFEILKIGQFDDNDDLFHLIGNYGGLDCKDSDNEAKENQGKGRLIGRNQNF